MAKAFLNRDLSTLKLHCGPELLERFSGIFKHHQQEVRARAAAWLWRMPPCCCRR